MSTSNEPALIFFNYFYFSISFFILKVLMIFFFQNGVNRVPTTDIITEKKLNNEKYYIITGVSFSLQFKITFYSYYLLGAVPQ